MISLILIILLSVALLLRSSSVQEKFNEDTGVTEEILGGTFSAQKIEDAAIVPFRLAGVDTSWSVWLVPSGTAGTLGFNAIKRSPDGTQLLVGTYHIASTTAESALILLPPTDRRSPGVVSPFGPSCAWIDSRESPMLFVATPSGTVGSWKFPDLYSIHSWAGERTLLLSITDGIRSHRTYIDRSGKETTVLALPKVTGYRMITFFEEPDGRWVASDILEAPVDKGEVGLLITGESTSIAIRKQSISSREQPEEFRLDLRTGSRTPRGVRVSGIGPGVTSVPDTSCYIRFGLGFRLPPERIQPESYDSIPLKNGRVDTEALTARMRSNQALIARVRSSLPNSFNEQGLLELECDDQSIEVERFPRTANPTYITGNSRWEIWRLSETRFLSRSQGEVTEILPSAEPNQLRIIDKRESRIWKFSRPKDVPFPGGPYPFYGIAVDGMRLYFVAPVNTGWELRAIECPVLALKK